MCYKKIDIDETRQEKFGYPNEGLPVVRICNLMNDFSGGKVDCHWHTEFQFGLVLKGQIHYCFFHDANSKTEALLQTGDGFFINSRVLHRYRQLTPGTEIFIFSISPTFFSSPVFGNIYPKMIIPVLQSPVSGIFFKQEEEQNHPILASLRDFHALNPQDTDYELHGLELLCKIWRNLFQRFSFIPKSLTAPQILQLREQRMQMMLNFIHTHYSEPLTVERIAQSGNTNKRECYRCFRTLISQSPMEYLNQYRLSIAAYMLLHSTQNLSNICTQCGFHTVSYFGKLFRKAYGTSPSQFRQMTR